MRHAVILAGGSGTRLWPLSRRDKPKQLLPLIEGRSLLRAAYERASQVVDDANILVCTNAAYLDAVADALPELPRANLLGEPVGRDSLNAVAWSTALVAARDPDASVAILGSDHVIEPVEEFTRALGAAFAAAEADDRALVTLGVVPRSPHTGFGYLHRGAARPGLAETFEVVEFAEKPAQDVAAAYLASGEWWWNSGMFCFHAATFGAALDQLMPRTAEAVADLVAEPGRLAEIYPQLEKISVDNAIMVPVSHGRARAHVLAVPLRARWDDVGSFPSLAPHLPQRDGNAVSGLALVVETDGSIVVNAGPADSLVVVAGLADVVVVSHDGVTLVCPKASDQSIKQWVERVEAEVGAGYV